MPDQVKLPERNDNLAAVLEIGFAISHITNAFSRLASSADIQARSSIAALNGRLELAAKRIKELEDKVSGLEPKNQP